MMSPIPSQRTMMKVVFLPWWPWMLVIPNCWVI